MDKLNALPMQQKVLAVVVGAAVIAGMFYYLVVTDIEARTLSATAQQRKLQTEYSQLKEFEKEQQQQRAQEEKAAEEAKLEENKKMLPSEDEIPSFIMSIKADADAAGLEVVKFDPQEAEIEDYYKRIPIKIEVLGKYLDFVDFTQTLAAPKKRIVNIRQLQIERLPMDVTKIQEALGEQSDYDQAARWRRMAKEERDMTNEERRMLKLQRWQLANEMNQVRATFVAYTFSYTGEPMPDELRKKRRVAKRRKRG